MAPASSPCATSSWELAQPAQFVTSSDSYEITDMDLPGPPALGRLEVPFGNEQGQAQWMNLEAQGRRELKCLAVDARKGSARA